MKTIITNTLKRHAERGSYYFDEYQGYRNPDGSRSSLFNVFSGYILDLKDGKPGRIAHFADLFANKVYDDDFTIVIVPSSDPAKVNTHGIKLMIDRFYNEYAIKKIINGADCLVRTVKVSKSVAGARSIQKHLNSIELRKKKLIEGRTVLLIDDVTTTGNSLAACKQILEKGGATEVILFSLGQTA